MIHKQLLVDHEIPTLAEVLDTGALAKHLRTISQAPWNGGGVEEAHVVRVLRHHAGQRCTLPASAATESPGRQRALPVGDAAAAAVSPVEMCAGHGSYNAAQVILNKGRTIVFGWDWFDIADPARDVSRFLYALRRMALDELGSIRALDGVAETFLKTYLAMGQRGVERNLRFFEAATCFNLAMRHLFDPDSNWYEKREKAEAMLDEGLQVLEREAA